MRAKAANNTVQSLDGRIVKQGGFGNIGISAQEIFEGSTKGCQYRAQIVCELERVSGFPEIVDFSGGNGTAQIFVHDYPPSRSRERDGTHF